jgi:hypothetical protein
MLIHNAEVTGSLNINNVPFNSGSFSGSFQGDGSQLTGVTGATTASYVEYSNVGNKPALVSGSEQVSFNGITDKPTLVSGSSQIVYSGISSIPAGIVSGSEQVSFNGITDKPTLVSGSSQVTYSGLSDIPVGIVSSSAQIAGYNLFATTGSNQFNGSQAITGSLTVTGQVVAQTLNVQQVTSSIVFSSGSNIFGNSLSNTQQFTGSVSVTGSLAVNGTSAVTGTGTTNYLPKFTGASTIGNSLLTDNGTTLAYGNNIISVGGSNTSEKYLEFGSSNGAYYVGGTSSEHYIFGQGDKPLRLYTNGTIKATLTSTGNLGLGVTPSAWSVSWTAQQFGQAGSLFAFKSGSNYTVLSNNSYAIGGGYQSGDARYINNGLSTAYIQNNSGQHLWMTAPSGTAGDAITFTQAMTLNASGRLLLGTTSDDGVSRLQVSGTIRTLSGNLDLYANNVSANFYDSANTNYLYSLQNYSSQFRLYNNNTSTTVLNFASTGAATFSSSVTATQFITGGTPSNTAGFTNSIYVEGSLPSLTLSNTGTNTGKFTLGVTNGSLGIWNNITSTYPIFINSSNNVGIGTTSPATHLHVSSGTHTKLRVDTTGVADASVEILGYDAGVHIGDPTNGNRWVIWNDGASTSSSLKFGSYALGTWYVDSSQAMTITSGGNVGIGTTSPTSKFFVLGNGSYNSTTSETLASDAIIFSSEMTNDAYNSILQLVSVRQSLSIGQGSNGFLGFSTIDDSNGQGIRDAGRIAIVNETGTARNSATALAFWTNAGGTNTTAATEKMRITSTGTVQPGVNGTQDLGTASLRWATVFTSDLSLSNGIGDYTIVEGENDLFLYNNKQNKVYKFLVEEVDPSTATPKKS